MTASRYGLEAFTNAFLQALFWSETDEANGDRSYPPGTEIDADGLDRLRRDCAKFYGAMTATWDGQCSRGSGEYTEDELAGHDFALTRNRHGAGFWDGGWSEPAASVLTEAAEGFGEVSLYRGDDGGVYVA